jgi:hypothetical protein
VSAGARGCPTRSGPHIEPRIVALALAGFGPRRINADLAREKWAGLRISEHGGVCSSESG